MNYSVRTVQVNSYSGRPPIDDLRNVFPNADTLHVRHCSHETHASELIDAITASSPALLQSITELRIILSRPRQTDNEQSSILHLLARCTSLTSLHLTHTPTAEGSLATCIFTGQGSCLDMRRASMQQQLAAICTTPAPFLAPASWPAHGCLTSLFLHPCRTLGDHLLHGALRCTSLASLSLDCCSRERGLFDCSAMSGLRNLTALSIVCPIPSSHAVQQGLCSTIAAPTSLVRLDIDRPILRNIGMQICARTLAFSGSWSRLVRLTHLELDRRYSGWRQYVDLQSLQHLTPLRSLQLPHTYVAGSLADLAPLAALTSLSGGWRTSLQHATAAGSSAGGNCGVPWQVCLLPQALQEGLVCLRWNVEGAEWRLLEQLRGLTKLELVMVELCPQLFRCLACLPELRYLHLDPDVRQRDHHLDAIASPPPVLPTLSHLYIAALPQHVSFERLASWAAVPSLRVLDVGEWHRPEDDYADDDEDEDDAEDDYADDAEDDYEDDDEDEDEDGHESDDEGWVSVAGLQYSAAWGAGWLSAVLVNQHPWEWERVVFLLHTDADVAAFVVGLAGAKCKCADKSACTCGGVHPWQRVVVDVALGVLVSAAGFRLLFEAAGRLPSCRLMLELQEARMGYRAHLPSSFFRFLRGAAAAGVHRLRLERCTQMQDADLQVLAAAAPGLEEVELLGAPLVSDEGLRGLAACSKLCEVRVGGCTRITAAGVVALLVATQQPLKSLCISGVQAEAVAALLRHKSWRRPVPPSDAWSIERGRCGVKCLLAHW